MKVRLTKSEMIAEWRLRKGLLPLSEGAEIVRSDGLSVDSIIERAIDDWYLNLLDTADPRLLPLTEFMPEVDYQINPDRSVSVTLPDRCRRVVSVRMSHWHRDAQLLVGDDTPLARLQRSEFTAGGACSPVAIATSRELTLYSAESEESTLESLIGIAEPAEGVYEMDREALAGITIIEI